MHAPRRRIFCRDHGEADACLVCIHLQKGHALGFHEHVDPARPIAREAWCDRCDFWRRRPPALAAIYNFIAGGETIICEHCLELARIGNERP
jgi:hypothetical protein